MSKATEIVIRPECFRDDHDNCPAWLRPFQLRECACDCPCHVNEGGRILNIEKGATDGSN